MNKLTQVMKSLAKRAYYRVTASLAGRSEKQSRVSYLKHLFEQNRGKLASESAPPVLKDTESDPKVVAYYLPQFSPCEENDRWWGRGTTEWNNVARAIPMYAGHHQPRLPGELGFYDLRVPQVFRRQVELAKTYGVHAFCFYYYWFSSGRRLLSDNLNHFVDLKLGFPFCLCWANESWTRRFNGSDESVLMEQDQSFETSLQFLDEADHYLSQADYLQINGRFLLVVYKPRHIERLPEVLSHWRQRSIEKYGRDLFLVAVHEDQDDNDWTKVGFDGTTDFQPSVGIKPYLKNIAAEFPIAQPTFSGSVYDYEAIVRNKVYFSYRDPSLFRSVMPSWDNSARRYDRGTIFERSTPELFEEWLVDVVNEGQELGRISDNLIFVNAWNEWGEGAYLEPDLKNGYAYLEAVRKAILRTRKAP